MAGGQEDKRASYNNILSHRERVRERGRKFSFTLAEVFHPAGKSRKVAFTLAEVLITLGIIGIVAALTMPALSAKHQKQVYVNKLKNQYSLWSNVFKDILVNEGVESLADTTVFQAIPDSGCGYFSYTDGKCAEFYKNLSKYVKLNVIKLQKNYEFSYFEETSYGMQGYDKGHVVIVTSSGGMLVNYGFSKEPEVSLSCEEVYKLGGKLCKKQGGFKIDVNGLKGPNKMGRDIFFFVLSDDGTLYPVGGKDVAVFIKSPGQWYNTRSWCGLPKEGSGHVAGDGCAARVMSEGWKMNY